jgi:hypothetical protein
MDKLTPEEITQLRVSLGITIDHEEVRKTHSSIWSPFVKIPYDQFQKFVYNDKESLLTTVISYINAKTSGSKSKIKQTIQSQDGTVKVFGLIGYKNDTEQVLDKAGFFLMYYFREAYSTCTNTWEQCVELYSITVPDEFRKQGIAKIIITELENHAISKKCRQLLIKAVLSPIMAGLLFKMGYQQAESIMNYCKVLN